MPIDLQRMIVARALLLLGRIIFLAAGLVVVTTARAEEPEEPRTAEAYLEAADSLVAELKTREAIALLEEAARRYPKHPDILWNLARNISDQTYSLESREAQRTVLQQATDLARSAVQAGPTNVNARITLAVCYGKTALISGNKVRLQLSRSMKQELDQAIRLAPDNDMAWHLLGRWEYEMADLGGFKRAIASVVYGNVPKGSFERARGHFEKALKLSPDRIIHLVELGRVNIELDDEPAARKALNRALSLTPKEAAGKDGQLEARRLLEKID